MAKKILKLAAVLAPAVLAVGCATKPVQPYDYSAFEASNPRSILVLPPVNNSPEVQAGDSMYSSVTYPLAESGFYVMPVALVAETFKQNGLTTANDIHNVDPAKLRQIFGADAALYMTVNKYGSSYNVISSVITIAAKAQLVDLRTRALLWEGEVSIVDDGNQGGNNGGGIVGLLVKAVVTQIMNSSTNRSHEVAARANASLLTAGLTRGLLYGPRSPHYKGRDASIPAAPADAQPQQVSLQPVSAPAPAVTPPVAASATAPAAAPAATAVAAARADVAAAPVPMPVAAAPVAAPAAAAPAPAASVAPVRAPLAAAQAAPVVITLQSSQQAPATPAEQRYADVLSGAQSRFQALNPSSAWYRQELYDWVMDRKNEYISAGKTPDVALKLALAAMEGRETR